MKIDLLVFDRPASRSTKTLSRQAPLLSIEMAISAFFNAAVKSTEKLRTLICAEDAGLAMTGKRFLDRFDAECRLQSDRQPPGQDASAEPVHDGGQKDGTPSHRNIGYIHRQTWLGRVTGRLRSR
jgi:hypothetical protein